MFLFVLVSLESLMNLVIDAIAKLTIFLNLLKFPISLLTKKSRHYRSRKAVTPNIDCLSVAN